MKKAGWLPMTSRGDRPAGPAAPWPESAAAPSSTGEDGADGLDESAPAMPGFELVGHVTFRGSVVIAGRRIGRPALGFHDDRGEAVAPDLVVASPSGAATAFLALWHGSRTMRRVDLGTGGDDGRVELPPAAGGRDALVSVLRELGEGLAPLLDHFAADPAWTAAIAAAVPEAPAGFMRAGGEIRTAAAVEGAGGLVVGWAVAAPGGRLRLIDGDGAVLSLDDAERWADPAVPEAITGHFGCYAREAGFLIARPVPVRTGDDLRLIWSDGRRALTIAEAPWSEAPVDPIEFARSSLAVATARIGFGARLERHDAPLIEALRQRAETWAAGIAADRRVFGEAPREPRVSVVVPLARRHEPVADQMLEISEDPWFLERVELILVVADPAIDAALQRDAAELYETYRVPFTLVRGRAARGFAAAVGLGVAESRGRSVLVLGSEVVPMEPGWLERMADLLDSSETIGVVGARLLSPDGAIRHDGLDHRWDDVAGCHFVHRPGTGFEPPEDGTGGSDSVRPAVGETCLLVRRATFEAVGGFDPAYLSGEFDAADFCMKVRATGAEVRCVTDVTLVDLDRRPFLPEGSDGFRRDLVLLDARRYERRWHDAIVALGERNGGEAR